MSFFGNGNYAEHGLEFVNSCLENCAQSECICYHITFPLFSCVASSIVSNSLGLQLFSLRRLFVIMTHPCNLGTNKAMGSPKCMLVLKETISRRFKDVGDEKWSVLVSLFAQNGWICILSDWYSFRAEWDKQSTFPDMQTANSMAPTKSNLHLR